MTSERARDYRFVVMVLAVAVLVVVSLVVILIGDEPHHEPDPDTPITVVVDCDELGNATITGDRGATHVTAIVDAQCLAP